MDRPLRVLIVDADADCAESGRLLLCAVGHACRTATDTVAEHVAREFDPDVVVFDPGRQPAVDRLPDRLRRACRRPVRFVAVGARADEFARQRVAAVGVFLFLAKLADPVFLLDLLTVLGARCRDRADAGREPTGSRAGGGEAFDGRRGPSRI